MKPRRAVKLPDGTTAYVHGEADPEALQAIKDAIGPMCGADLGRPMPALAQRIHGRENYVCGRPLGHEGPHRWPGEAR